MNHCVFRQYSPNVLASRGAKVVSFPQARTGTLRSICFLEPERGVEFLIEEQIMALRVQTIKLNCIFIFVALMSE